MPFFTTTAPSLSTNCISIRMSPQATQRWWNSLPTALPSVTARPDRVSGPSPLTLSTTATTFTAFTSSRLGRRNSEYAGVFRGGSRSAKLSLSRPVRRSKVTVNG